MTKQTKQVEIPAVLNAIIKHCAAYGQPSRKFLLNVLKDFEAQAQQEAVEKVLKIIQETIGNDYHNIGMGSLDYHEKCVVDAFIESFTHRIEAPQKEQEYNKLNKENNEH